MRLHRSHNRVFAHQSPKRREAVNARHSVGHGVSIEFLSYLTVVNFFFLLTFAGFTSARKALRTGGYLLVADYFVYYRNERGSPHLKSSHPMKAYLKAGEAAGFKLLKEYDNYNFI